jgi:hypothetical protein
MSELASMNLHALHRDAFRICIWQVNPHIACRCGRRDFTYEALLKDAFLGLAADRAFLK